MPISLSDIFGKAKQAARKTIIRAGQKTQQFLAPVPGRTRLRDVARELPGAASELFVQTPLRAAKSIEFEARRKKEPTAVPSLIQPFLGKEPIEPFSQMQRTQIPTRFLRERGVPEPAAKLGGLAVGLGLTLAEADPRIGLSGGKVASTLADDTQEFLKLAGKPKTALEKKAIARVAKNLGEALSAYIDRVNNTFGVTRGHIIAADEGKYVVNDIANGYGTAFKAEQSVPYHELGSALSKIVEKHLLANKQTKELPGLILSGGSGAGKTSALRMQKHAGAFDPDDYAIIYDANLTTLKSASRRIDNVINSGRGVDIKYVYRDPVEAFTDGVVKRMKSQGRIVPVEVHLENHVGAYKTIKQVAKKYGENVNIDVFVNGKNPYITTVDKLPTFGYTKDGLRNKLYDEIEQLYKAGEITDSQLKAYVAGAPPATVARFFKQGIPVSPARLGIRAGAAGVPSTTVLKDLEPLAQEAIKHKSAQEFVAEMRRVFSDTNPFGDQVSTFGTPHIKQPLVDAFQRYAGLRAIQKLYKQGKNDTDVLTRFYNHAVRGGRAIAQEVRLKKTRAIIPTVALESKRLENPRAAAVTHSIASEASQYFGKDVKGKVSFLDYVRTPEYVLKKIGLGKHFDFLRKKWDDYLHELPTHIDKITDWRSRAGDGPDVSGRLFRYLDGQDEVLTAQEEKVALEIKSYLKQWANRLGLPEDKQISHYITHIFDMREAEKEFDPDIARLISESVAGSVYDPFLIKRLGKKGYIEDVWRSLEAYVKRGTRKANLDEALKPIKAVSKKLEVSQYKYVKRFIDRVNMRPTEVDNLIDNFIKQLPLIGYRFGQRPTMVLTRMARKMTYVGALGLNIGTFLRNLTQGVNTYAKLGEKYTLIGYTQLAKHMAVNDFDEVRRAGILMDGFVQDRRVSALKRGIEKADRVLFLNMDLSEKINRGAAYYGAKAQAVARGMGEKEAIEYAKKIVRETQFFFGAIDTPPALQSDINKFFLQFQSFNIKQAEFLMGMLKNKEWAGLARFTGGSLAMVYVLGEALGLDWQDQIPFSSIYQGRFKLGEVPLVRLGKGIAKSALQMPDEYGNVPQGPFLERLAENRDVAGALPALIPAGVQIKKTYEGITATRRGYSQSRKGRLRYPMLEKDLPGIVKSALFGQYSNKVARVYFDLELKPLGDKQTEKFRQLVDDGADARKTFYVLHRQRLENSIKDYKNDLKKDDETPIEERQLLLDARRAESQEKLDELAKALDLTDDDRDALSGVTIETKEKKGKTKRRKRRRKSRL